MKKEYTTTSEKNLIWNINNNYFNYDEYDLNYEILSYEIDFRTEAEKRQKKIENILKELNNEN